MRALSHFPSLLTARNAMSEQWQQSAPASYISLILSSLGVGYFSIDRGYNITDVNGPALKWLNMERKAVIGQRFSAIVPQSPMKMLKAAVEEKVFVDRQLTSYQRPDRLLDLHIYPTNNGAIVFFRDLTEHKLQHQEAMRAKLLLQSSLDASSAHVVVLDEAGTVIASNAAWQKFAVAQGLSVPGSAKPLNYLELFNKPLARRRDALKIGAALTSLLSGGCHTAHLLHAWPITGKIHWFQLNAARFECWGKTYLVVANEDVTAVKDAQQASEEMAERLLTLQEDERQRIAKELHDSTAQHLVAIGLNIMKLKSTLQSKARHSELFKEIETSVQEASKELRTFTYLLHPPRLDDDGFRETAERYAHGFGKRTGLSVNIRIKTVSDSAPFELQRCLFRIMQEALTNIHRHASASQVQIVLRYLRQQLHLIVRDNGMGISSPARTASREFRGSSMGVGIPGMRERLRQFGGELAIRSGSGGTRLHAIVPFVAGVQEHNGYELRTASRVATPSQAALIGKP